MQVLVMAATEMEIQPFLDSHAGVDVLISGVGAPSTVYHLLKKLNSTKYDMVVQAGIAGRSQHSMLQLTDCVLVKSDVFADLGIQEAGEFYSISDMNFTHANEHPYSNGRLLNNHSYLVQSALPKVCGITVNKISDDPQQSTVFYRKYQAEVESMEGAALHFVCLLESIPFLQLRCISNDIGVRDKSKWRMRESIQNLNLQLDNIIKTL